MKIIDLKNPHVNGFADENDPSALIFVKKMNEAKQALREGRLYARFISGDRKGSVCKVISRHDNIEDAKIGRYSSWDKKNYRLENTYIYGIGKWTGRSNKPKLQLPHRDVEVIIDYDGPTIWEKFDAKSAKEEILKDPDQKDMDGNVLAIGDKVLYINARYGSGMTLDRGVIKEFKVSVDSNTHSISTVVENESETLSTINNPRSMILKYV